MRCSTAASAFAAGVKSLYVPSASAQNHQSLQGAFLRQVCPMTILVQLVHGIEQYSNVHLLRQNQSDNL
jgi:hypothetical protein